MQFGGIRVGENYKATPLVWEGRLSLPSGRRSKLRTRRTVSVPSLAVMSSDLVGIHLAVTQAEAGTHPYETC